MNTMNPRDLIFDTHAIRLLINSNFREDIVKYVRDKCHNLIFPRLESEYRVHVSSFPNMVGSLREELRGKFIPDETPTTIPQPLEKILKKYGANENDLKIVGVALKRRRGEQRIPVIVSNDQCFNKNLRSLRAHDIDCISVDALIEQIHEC